MVKNDKGNILCRNNKGREQYLSPLYIANPAIMEKYGWEVVEEPQAPPVNVDDAITEVVEEPQAAKAKRTRKKKLNQAA